MCRNGLVGLYLQTGREGMAGTVLPPAPAPLTRRSTTKYSVP